VNGGPLVRQLVLALGAAVVVAIAYAAWRSAGQQGKAVQPWAGAAVDWGKPARHGCDTGWLGNVLPHPHPIYRQTKPSAARDGLAAYGWAWVFDPPGEMGLSS
jgi:hypothetical protein